LKKAEKKRLAEDFGFSLAMLRSNKELSRLFDRAVDQTWAPDRFVAAVRSTKWYKRNSESERNAQVQKKADPATYKANVKQTAARVRILARELGSQAPSERLGKIAENAYKNGWDDNQLRRLLSDTIRYGNDGRMEGQAGEWERQWREYAKQMGVTRSRKWYRNQARRAVKGTATPEEIQANIMRQAQSAYPQFKGRIQAGETLEDIAEPYRQVAGELLERDPEAFGLRASLMQRALNQRNKDGQPTSMNLENFRDLVRQDSRWKYTDNAKEAGDATVRALGQMFGKIS